ncbi:hypothetical protein JAAARDRAFT_194281 [Jaapia argillacea MUCL 33604]|uniref:Uncharacterized protein n=1 Tax=Jaapia argillacea MUCL 33604 TaxID=933084 RepID=A0A067PQK7_9AGAM|nr:hypothetical protein JAAARDRAFT_194281 [Jaapia argillacea MUCL 33604]
MKKLEAAARAEARKMKKDWEASLIEWKSETPDRGTRFADGTKVVFKSEAKSYYKLSDKDMASLPYYQFPASSKRVFPVASVIKLVERRFEATGIAYPRFPISSMDLNGPRLTNLVPLPDGVRMRRTRY